MNYIDISNPKIDDAKKKHFTALRYIIKKKINGVSFQENSPFPHVGIKCIKLNSKVKKFFNDENNLKTILIGTPNELSALKNTFTTPHEKKSLNRILNYEGWRKHAKGAFEHYHAYVLASNLDIPTCTYCNRLYTKTVIVNGVEKITRPTFDHWFPKAKYPIFALSFFNLIPSCSVCNSGIKGEVPFELKTHFHPYFKSMDKQECLDFSFSYKMDSYNKHNFKINSNNNFSKTSIEAFKLKEIYESHEDEIKDLVLLRNSYSTKYLEELKKTFSSSKISDEEIYRLAFGTHFDEANFDRRPLSRMKRDILKELGII